jgi:hypothetical protein
MGITPITNLTQLLQPRTVGSEIEPPPMARVENSARTGDETYSSSNGKSARGSEDDGSEDDFVDLPEEEEAESASEPAAPTPTSQISFFA